MPVGGGEAKQLTNSTKESTYIVSCVSGRRAISLPLRQRRERERASLSARARWQRARPDPGEKTKAKFLGWSQDRKSFFFSTNARDPKFFDIFEMSDRGPEAEAAFTRMKPATSSARSRTTRRFIAFGKPGRSTADSDVYLYNIATKEMKNITAHKGDVANSRRLSIRLEISLFPVGRRQRIQIHRSLRSRERRARSGGEDALGCCLHSISRTTENIAWSARTKTRARKSKIYEEATGKAGDAAAAAGRRHQRGHFSRQRNEDGVLR